MNATTYGLDVAKGVFQMYWVDGETGEIVNRRFRRDALIRVLGTTTGRSGGVGSVRLRALVGTQDQGAWARSRAAACQVYSPLCADEQNRCGGRAGDLDGGAAAGDADRGSEDRRSAGDAQSAPDARLAGQVPDHAGKSVTRVVVRVWRDVSDGTGGWVGRDSGTHGRAGGCAAGHDDRAVCRTSCNASTRSSKILIGLSSRSALGRSRKRRAARSRKCRASASSPQRRWWRRWAMRRRSSRVVSLLHFLGFGAAAKAVPAARSDWDRSPSGATRTCARC